MGPWEITLTPFVISSTQAHSTERATHDTPQSSLHQHHTTSHSSPDPLPELQKNLSQNRTQFPQNPSHANPSLPTGHHPNNLPGPKKSVAKSDTISSKSIACCNLFPPLRVKKIYESLPTCRPLAIMLVSVM